MTAAGSVRGNSTVPGVFSVPFTVTDAIRTSAGSAVEIVVGRRPTFVTAFPLPQAVTGEISTVQIEASDANDDAIAFSITIGSSNKTSLTPEDLLTLSLAPSCRVPFTVQSRATDATGLDSIRIFQIPVIALPV